MENWHGSSRRSMATMRDDGDFEEDDIWTLSSSCATEIGSSRRSKDSSRRIIKKNSSSSAKQSSSPINIPEWSSNANHGRFPDMYDGRDNDDGIGGDHGDGDYDDHDDGEMVPPHEWIARKLARTQISSFSMCEGIGRTLKGRDLKRVRNAVLSKTGFLE